MCVIYGSSIKSTQHVVRGCSRPRQVWWYLLLRRQHMPFWRCTSMDEWLKLNLDSTYFLFGKYHGWAYLSREAIYVFWRHDNLKVLHSIDYVSGLYLWVNLFWIRLSSCSRLGSWCLSLAVNFLPRHPFCTG